MSLVRALRANTTLKSLKLRGNPFGVAGLHILAEVLSQNCSSLRLLDLADTMKKQSVDAGGCAGWAEGKMESGLDAIAAALNKPGATLQTLHLEGNGITEREASWLRNTQRAPTTSLRQMTF